MSTQKPTTKEYFRNYPGFRIESGNRITEGELKGKTVDVSIHTDEAQGFAYYKDGYYKSVTNGTSYEICGYKSTTEDDYAKILAAGSGHILIDAQDGDVIIKGRNIRLSAEDGSGEITLVSGKHVYIKGAVCHIKGTNINILGSNNLSMAATFVEETGSVSNEGGTMTDIFQGSFLGSIFKFLDKFKDFL